jgi:hypothetical protein
VVFLLARRPDRLDATHPRIIEDLLELIENNRQDAVDAIITMLEDFHARDMESRFVKKLKGLPVWELKTRARGGPKGGARVDFFLTLNPETEAAEAVIVNAETKDGDTPSDAKLQEVLEIALAFRKDAKTMRRRSS